MLPDLCKLLDSPYWEVRKLVVDIFRFICLVEEDEDSDEEQSGQSPRPALVDLLLAALAEHSNASKGTQLPRASASAGTNSFRSIVRACLEVVDSRGIFGTAVGAGRKIAPTFQSPKEAAPTSAVEPGGGFGGARSVFTKLAAKVASNSKSGSPTKQNELRQPDDSEHMSMSEAGTFSQITRSIFGSSNAEPGKQSSASMDFLVSFELADRVISTLTLLRHHSFQQ
jgi:hypothetical protein